MADQGFCSLCFDVFCLIHEKRVRRAAKDSRHSAVFGLEIRPREVSHAELSDWELPMLTLKGSRRGNGSLADQASLAGRRTTAGSESVVRIEKVLLLFVQFPG